MGDAANKYKPQQSGFFKMDEPGNYRVRVVSELEPVMKAPFREQDPAKQKLKVSTVFYCRVIDRKDGELKLWEMGWSIYQQYLAMSRDTDYAFDDFPGYDLKIEKIKTGPEKQNVKYNVLPAPVSPLSQEEMERIAKAKPMVEIAAKAQQTETQKMLELGVHPQDANDQRETLSRPLVEGDPGYTNPKDIPF